MESIIEKYKLDKSTWTYKGLHGVLHTFFPVGMTGFPMKKFFGDSCQVTLFIIKDNYTYWYWNDNDLTRFREVFLKRIKASPTYLKKLEKQWQDEIKKFDEVILKVERADLSKLTNKKLYALYKDFYKKYLNEFTYFMALGDAVSMHADRYLVPEFQKVLGKDFSKVFTQLISTSHISFIREEERERNELIDKFKNKKLTADDLKEHSEKYFFINNNYAKATYLDGKYFLTLIEGGASKKNKKENKKIPSNIKKLEKKYKLTAWHKTLIYIMDEFFGIQDTRKKYVLISNYYQFKFLKEAERRGGIPFELLLYSVFPEYLKALEGKLDKSILRARKKVCVCIETPGKYELITGKKALGILSYFQKSGQETKELKGIIASRGKVKGRVKIILKSHDMANMKQGDILVSSMTRPEMMAAVKRAGGIVTDEGGITCHAAIVSREMKIPCIIGAKSATQVLKDGDMVEVDANKGIIKILRK